MGVTHRQVSAAYAANKAQLGGVLENYFGFLYLQSEFGLDSEVAASQIAFAQTGLGVDGFHIDRETRTLFLFKFLWTTSHAAFDTHFENLTRRGLNVIFAPELDPGNTSSALGLARQIEETPIVGGAASFLAHLRSLLPESKALIQYVRIQFVYHGDVSDVEKSPVVQHLREDLSRKGAVVDEYFGRPVLLSSSYVCERNRKRNSVRATHAGSWPLQMADVLSERGPTGESMTVGFCRLVDLGRMFEGLGQEFLERNIRAGLSEELGPNRALYAALKGIANEGVDPKVFAFNHNGVTLAADGLEPSEQGYLLTNPRLLNGAQSVTTFERFLKTTGISRKDKRLEQVRLVCRIILKASPDFITAVTICNNRQNPVMPWHLRANDLIQVRLQDWFARSLGIYYERQEKSFANLQNEDLERLSIVDDKALSMQKLASTYLASDGMVDKMTSMRQVFESEKTYAHLFNDQRLDADPRLVIMCYKVDRCLRKILSGIQGAGETTRYAYLYRARNLLWALLCQAILNDERRLERAEEYGTNLVLTQDFRDWIDRLVEKQVRSLIGEVVREAPFAERKDAEQYDFLRTRVFYDRCMEIGRSKYTWRSRRLV